MCVLLFSLGGSWLQWMCCGMYAAKSRNIGVPGDLEAQCDALYAKSQMVQKHTKLWLSSANRGRVDTIQSQDYRNIVEGLQVVSSSAHVFIVFHGRGKGK